ncbi:MAG: hypothetical protein WAL61_14995 [Acidimicrobiales bacterium]
MTARHRLSMSSAAGALVLGSLALSSVVAIVAQPIETPLVGSATAAAAAAPTAPFTDPSAVGSIGLCNQAGQQITEGSITTRPFAWRAVSTQAAPAPYNNAGRTAILVAYLPQQGLPAGDWSGTEMTASSNYTNPANPMAAATDGDESLQSVVEEFPPKWDGFLQLRMYLDTANRQPYESQYPTLNIQVTGDTWQAVGGSQVNCSSGTAESIETVLLPSTTTTTSSSPPAPTTTPAVVSGNGTSSGGASSATATPVAGGKGTSRDRAAIASSTPAAADSGGSTNVALILGVGIPLLVLLAALTVLVRRRRLASSASGPAPDTADQTSSPMKGDPQ